MITAKKSAELVAEFESTIKGIEFTITKLQSKVDVWNDQINNLVTNIVSKEFPESTKHLIYPLAGWKCEASKNPFDLCVYDEGKDPVLDYCLYCEQPQERL